MLEDRIAPKIRDSGFEFWMSRRRKGLRNGSGTRPVVNRGNKFLFEVLLINLRIGERNVVDGVVLLRFCDLALGSKINVDVLEGNVADVRGGRSLR